MACNVGPLKNPVREGKLSGYILEKEIRFFYKHLPIPQDPFNGEVRPIAKLRRCLAPAGEVNSRDMTVPERPEELPDSKVIIEQEQSCFANRRDIHISTLKVHLKRRGHKFLLEHSG